MAGTDWASGAWMDEEWATSNKLFSGGEQGRKWYRWCSAQFYWGFTATRLDGDAPVLTVLRQKIEHVGVHGFDPVIRFSEPHWPGKGFIWVIESITEREPGEVVVQVQQPEIRGNPQTWKMQAVDEQTFMYLMSEGGWEDV